MHSAQHYYFTRNVSHNVHWEHIDERASRLNWRLGVVFYFYWILPLPDGIKSCQDLSFLHLLKYMSQVNAKQNSILNRFVCIRTKLKKKKNKPHRIFNRCIRMAIELYHLCDNNSRTYSSSETLFIYLLLFFLLLLLCDSKIYRLSSPIYAIVACGCCCSCHMNAQTLYEEWQTVLGDERMPNRRPKKATVTTTEQQTATTTTKMRSKQFIVLANSDQHARI